jgi:DnaJ-class molecular chaperone
MTTINVTIESECEAMVWLTKTPLVFGSTTQIAAVRFIEQADRCEEILLSGDFLFECDECDGEGTSECYACHAEEDCDSCGGTGFMLDVGAIHGFTHEVVQAAKKRIER